MHPLTIQQAAEATGWSQRMLRYLEQAGLVSALRTPGGHRHYGPRQIERLQKLRELIDGHGLGITDIAFELRMRTDPQLARAVDDWFGPLHRSAAPPEAGIYRRLATDDAQHTVPSRQRRRTRDCHPHRRTRPARSATSRSPTSRSPSSAARRSSSPSTRCPA